MPKCVISFGRKGKCEQHSDRRIINSSESYRVPHLHLPFLRNLFLWSNFVN